MPATIAQQVDAYAYARAAIAARTTATTVGVVSQFDGWYSDPDIAKFAKKISQFVQGGQRQTAALTDAYLTRVTGQMRGESLPPVGVVDVKHLRKGVEHDEVYERLANNYRWRISEGDEPETALATVTNRAVEMASTDMDLAFREQMETFMDEREVTEYRRIVRPEMSQEGSCGLCVVAADRIYYREDLFELHARCKCTVLPITDDEDPGLELNQEDFARIYAAAGDTTSGKALKRVRIAVKEHGEIGAVLVRAGDAWRDKEDVDRDSRD